MTLFGIVFLRELKISVRSVTQLQGTLSDPRSKTYDGKLPFFGLGKI